MRIDRGEEHWEYPKFIDNIVLDNYIDIFGGV